MKPGSPRRVRRALLLLGACWLVLSTAWVARRWWAVRILDAEAAVEYGMECEWQLPFEAELEERTRWARLWPSSHVTKVSLYRATGIDPKLAWAVQVCGRLERIKVISVDGPADPRELLAWLAQLGEQPGLQELWIDEVSLTDEDLASALAHYPGLRILWLSMTKCTGANLPVMPSLEIVETSFSPISDAGLAALLRQPAVQSISIVHGEVTRAGVLQIPPLRRAGLEELHIHSFRLKQSELPELDATIRAAGPGWQFFELGAMGLQSKE
jgi:hypothetical protein